MRLVLLGHLLHDTGRGVRWDLPELPPRFVPAKHGRNLQRSLPGLPLGDLLDTAGGQRVHELPRQQRFGHLGGGPAIRLSV